MSNPWSQSRTNRSTRYGWSVVGNTPTTIPRRFRQRFFTVASHVTGGPYRVVVSDVTDLLTNDLLPIGEDDLVRGLSPFG
jgi:hypothetical protein